MSDRIPSRTMSMRDRDHMSQHLHHHHHHHHHPHGHHRDYHRGSRRNNVPPIHVTDPNSCTYKVKEFARKLVAFLFGHVGICGLVVGYIIMGAFAFMAIESEDQKKRYEDVVRLRETTIQNLWNITHELNVLYPSEWNESVSDQVRIFQQKIVQFVIEGYDGKNYNASLRSQTDDDSADGLVMTEVAGAWSFSASFLYCLTVITTIGTVQSNSNA